MILAAGVDQATAHATAMAEPGPVRVLSLPEVDANEEVAAALGARHAEVWVIRPDATSRPS